MAGAQVLGRPNECVLPHPYLIAAARLPSPRAEHTGTGMLRASTGDERVVSSGQARSHMASWAVEREHHSPCKGKPKPHVKVRVSSEGVGGD